MSSPVKFETLSENPQFEGVLDISASELQQKLSQVKIVDVREPDEYTGELGHIHGAELIPLHTLPDELATLPKDQTIVFVCKGGGRSAKATAFAHMNGLKNVFNMQGGMMQWNNLQLPIER
jgi:hydroxyacylglutathione hydrolase